MMLRTILAAIDFSPSSDVALDHACALARAADAELILAHSTPDLRAGAPLDGAASEPGAPALSARYAELMESERLERERRLRSLTTELIDGGFRARYRLLGSSVPDQLVRAAKEESADLVVLGTRGATGLDRVLLGSVAERTVRHCPVPALVARPGGAPGQYRKIIVGTEFSAGCAVALTLARSLAGPDDSIDVVHAWSVPVMSTLGASAATENLRRALEAQALQTCSDWVVEHAPGDNRIQAFAVEQSAVEALCARADAIGADLLVVGSHSRTWLGRLILGSTAEAAVRHAPCSIVVAHAVDGDDETDSRTQPTLEETHANDSSISNRSSI